MKFSLIVTTINKDQELIRFFESLSRQVGIDLANIEVIFIDQGNNKDTLRVLNREINVKYKKIQLSSLSKARNEGLKLVSGEIIAFPDDDCWYSEKLLLEVYKNIDSNCDAVCFNVKDPDKNLYYGNRPLIVEEIKFSTVLKYPISVGLFLYSKNIKGKLFFDEKLGVGNEWGAGEESDFLIRYMETGAKIVYNGFIDVYHPVEEYSSNDVMKFYKYGLGMGALLGKHSDKRKYFLAYYVNIIARGIMGFLIYFMVNRNKAFVYFNRTKSILLGYKQGKEYYANNSR